MAAPAAPHSASRPLALAGRLRMGAAVAQLSTANAIIAAGGLVTGPLLARALGTTGRGDLAAILVPLAMAPPLLGLGLPAYVYRELPRGRAPNVVLGSLAVPMLLVGLAGAAVALPLAGALADGRSTVQAMLTLGFLLLPLALVTRLIPSALGSSGNWPGLVTNMLVTFAVPAATTVALYAFDALTVERVAFATIAGGVIAALPGARMFFAGGRPRFERAIAREGVLYGLRSWLGGLAMLANARLDQLLMITAVAPRELGLYAVAVSVSGLSGIVTSAINPPLMTRVARGDTVALRAAVRATFLGTLAFNALVAAAAPVLLPAVFGHAFSDAVPMLEILLLANVFTATSSVLSSGLQAGGKPGLTSIAEAAALAVTALGLALLLGPLAGLGAALVSLLAYATSCVIQVVGAVRLPGVNKSISG